MTTGRIVWRHEWTDLWENKDIGYIPGTEYFTPMRDLRLRTGDKPELHVGEVLEVRTNKVEAIIRKL